MTSQRKPGQIRCNSTLTVSGQPCKKYRPLDKQCAVEQHKRTWDEIERIAREHCLRTGDPLPASFGDLADKLNAQRQSWLVEYKLLGCRYGMGVKAAINAGITEDPKQFAYHARKALQPEISAWLDEYAMPANEAIAIAASMARGEVPTKRVEDPGGNTATFDTLAAVNTIIECHGLKKTNVNVTTLTDEQLAAEVAKIHSKLNGNSTDPV